RGRSSKGCWTMIDDELIRETTAALDDLGELAPKPPTLAAITAGYAPLRRIEPRRSRWRFVAALAGAAAVTLLVVGIAALVGSGLGGDTTQSVPVGATDPSGRSINGTWVLVSYTYEGETHTVEAATVAAQKQIFAWIEISDETVTGNTGCNSLDGNDAPQLDGDVLVFGEILTSAVGCLEETSEPAFLDALRSGPDGVKLLIDNDTMTWTTDTVELTFERRARRPVPPPPTWGTTFGRLDCSPGVYLTQNLPGADISLTDALRSIGGVGRVQEGDPFWWGLDEGGVVIAGAAYGDIEPRVVELSACASFFGLRSDADLGAASYTWVNDLGLSQTSPIVWSSRFIEMCSPASPDLSTLAQRYLEEDAATSVRADGSNPTLEEAVDRLDVIRSSTCGMTLVESTTTTESTVTDGLASTTTSITSNGPVTCSATSIEIPADYPASYENLPDAVDRTRSMLMDAALGCDFETLVSIAKVTTDIETTDAIFWGAAGTVEGLVVYDRDTDSLRSLALALMTLPTGVFFGERYDEAAQATVPDVYYSWPPVHDDLGDGVGLENVWDTDTLTRVAALNGQSVAELVAFSNEFGAYAGFRVGIAEDGRWIFALAGD
ncbi:MAG: META domain-containing protein, partial [Acidimicrobiia bacterium]